MKILSLNNAEVLVDDEDYNWICNYKWSNDGRGYARRVEYFYENGKRKQHKILMHREIMGNPEGFIVDHINGNRLDNQKSNLRLASVQENSRNRKPLKETKGIYKRGNKFIAQITIDKRKVYLGIYTTIEEAISVYDHFAKTYFGEFAYLNRRTQCQSV